MTSSTHHTHPHASASDITSAASRLPERKPFTAQFTGNDVVRVYQQRARADYLAKNSTELHVSEDIIRFNFKNFDEPTYPDTPLTHVMKAVAQALDINLDANELAQLQHPNPRRLNVQIDGINASDVSGGRFAIRLVGKAKDAYNTLQQAVSKEAPTASAGRS